MHALRAEYEASSAWLAPGNECNFEKGNSLNYSDHVGGGVNVT